jgi:hypothetical protein
MIHFKIFFFITIEPIYYERLRLIGKIIIDLKANMLIILKGSVM